MSKRLLFIAYEFPPKGGTQAQHTAKLAVALAQRGWILTAVSVADPPTAMVDAGLQRAVSVAVRVVPVWSLEPTRMVQSLHG